MKWKLLLLLFILCSSCEKQDNTTDIFLKFFGDAREDIGYSISQTDNGYIISGQLTELLKAGSIASDEKTIKKFGIIKCGPDGNLIWKNSFPSKLSGVCQKVISLSNGTIVSTGYVTDSVTLQKDIIVVKINSDGTNPIQKVYKSSGNQIGNDVLETPEGFLILGSTDVERLPITQSTGNVAGKKDVLILRINTNLDQIAAPIALGFPGNDVGAVIKKDISDGYMVVGTTDRSEPGQSSQAGNNVFLLKINTDGNTTQPAIIGGADDEYAADIEVLSDGYLITGSVGEEGVNQGIFTSRVSRNIYESPYFNVFDFRTLLPSFSSFSVRAMSRFQSNYFVMAGQAGSGSSAKQLFFITDDYGNLFPDNIKLAGGSGLQIAYDILSETNGDIVAVGKNTFEKNTMISLFKFRF